MYSGGTVGEREVRDMRTGKLVQERDTDNERFVSESGHGR